jgi:DNA-binding SARP family transcriptional activator
VANLARQCTAEPGCLLASAGSSRFVVEVQLLGDFNVRTGDSLLDTLPPGSQRILAFLALQDRASARIELARALWPLATDRAAGMSLRSALSRFDAITRGAISTISGGLELREDVIVDLRQAQAVARRLIHSETMVRESDLSTEATEILSTELLPAWHESWVTEKAEIWRHLRVNALEAQSRFLVAQGSMAEAAYAARAAINVEPLRESAHMRLIEVHLAEGNAPDAMAAFHQYKSLLLDELGLEPTWHMRDLVAGMDDRRREG